MTAKHGWVSTRAAAGAYLKHQRVTGAISQATLQHMRGPLYQFCDLCPKDPAAIRRRDVKRWLRTTTHLSAGTRRLYQGRVHGFTDWLLRRGVLAKDPFLDVPPPKVPRAVHRSLEGDQVQALLAACVTPRDRMVVILGLHTGLRRAELAALEVGDVSLSGRTVFVRKGKNGDQRMLPLSEEAVREVGRYVAEAALTHGPLLRSLADPHAGIRPGTVSRIFSELAYRSGVKMKPWDTIGPHSMRHTYATDTHLASSDVVAVSELLGHRSLNTTRRYIAGMSVERLRSAVEGKSYVDGAA